AYECGGLYPRGLLFQYLIALLQLGGMSPEMAPRLIAALSSLAALPAVYILGRRAHSRTVGLLAVAILSLSVWEVEIARFGRMYAPFQAVFAWYLVYLLKYTVDREQRARWPMLILTIVGALAWEGAVLLALVNLLPPFLNHSSGRLSPRDLLYLAGATLLFVLIAWFVTLDVRLTGPEPPFPADYDDSLNKQALLELEPTVPPWTTLIDHAAWAVFALIPMGAAFVALRWIWTFRERWLVAIGFAVALAAAMFHQFAVLAALILLLLMLRLLNWKELFSRAAFPFHVAVMLSLAFWSAYGLLTNEWREGEGTAWPSDNRIVAIVYEFVRFPDILREIVWPWGQAVPILGLALLALSVIGVIRTIGHDNEGLSAERVIQVVLVCMVLAAAATNPPRHETRYVFFLYPLAVIVALTAIARVVEAAPRLKQRAAALTVVTSLVGFALTEDFRPRHLLNIDSAEVTFRVLAAGRAEAHYHPRSDPRGAANWLAEHATDDRDLVINGFPSVDFYFKKFDFTYIDWRHRRFEAYACQRGTLERWGNLPLLYTVDAVESQIDNADRAFLVLAGAHVDELVRQLARLQPQIAWTSIDGQVNVVAFKEPSEP
ncbi:MAG: hypothetical protein L0387_45720, partial [Acidobacteria bacterium]|nr:hypothetical protein [Acidobacteriota bacterium]